VCAAGTIFAALAPASTMKTTKDTKPKARKTRRRKPDRWASLRRDLLRRRQELLRQMRGELVARGADNVGANYNDLADQASEALYKEMAHGFAEIATADLRMIDRALERIEKKTYGRCEACGKRISPGRLRALPFAELCVDCKRQEEGERGETRPLAPPPHP